MYLAAHRTVNGADPHHDTSCFRTFNPVNISTCQHYLMLHHQPLETATSLGPMGILFLARSFCSAAPWGRPLAPRPCPRLSWCSLPCLPELNDSPQVRKYKSMILEDLESALAEHAPTPQEVNSELPPLTIDGIPVSVDKMTQVSGQMWQNQRDLASCSHILLFCSGAYVYISRGRIRSRLSRGTVAAQLDVKLCYLGLFST